MIVKFTNRFKKSYKLMIKQGRNISLLDKVIEDLKEGIQLEIKYKDHQLSGNYRYFRECHIGPDWLLIYMIDKDKDVLTLVDTGSHSDLLDI